MGDKTKIEWTEATWNPIRGCTRVSEGCRNCYAERVAARFSGPGEAYEGLAKLVTIDKMGHKEARWTGQVRYVTEHLRDPLRWKRPRMIFVNSMSDLFHEKVHDEWIEDIWDVMLKAKQHTFQILTKRPGRMLEWVSNWKFTIGKYSVLPNVWLGVSVEDQSTADERIPILLETQAAIRWVSYEPALGPVDFRGLLGGSFDALTGMERTGFNTEAKLDWIVCGGESGPGARPMHPDWARSARDQCVAAGIPFFMKQWGEWVAPEQNICALHNGGEHGYVSDGFEHSKGCPNAKQFVVRMGKKAAGRLLDGQTWSQYPPCH